MTIVTRGPESGKTRLNMPTLASRAQSGHGHSRQPRRKRSHLTVKNKTEKSCATSLSVVLIIPQRAADCKPLHRRVAALEALIRRQGRIFVVQLPQQYGTAHHADEHIAVIHHRHKVLFDGCL